MSVCWSFWLLFGIKKKRDLCKDWAHWPTLKLWRHSAEWEKMEGESFSPSTLVEIPYMESAVYCGCSMIILIDHCWPCTDPSNQESGEVTDFIFKRNCYIYSRSSKIEDLSQMYRSCQTELLFFWINMFIFRETI